MRGMLLIARRELMAYFNSIWGYVVVASVLALNGLFFNVFAVTSRPRLSSDVLEDFFYYSSGFITIGGVLLSMRLLAEERQNGTMSLLDSSPLSDAQIVGGKFLSAFIFLSGMTLLTLYMPALIFVNGKVSLGHIAAGYAGLLLAGAASVAIGTFGSALVRSQLVAVVISAFFLVFSALSWMLGRVVDPPLDDLVPYLSIYDAHFIQTFAKGRVNTEDIVYYLSVTFVFLLLSTRILSSRRWR